jgi:restriction endonuclease Mrr
MKNKSIAFENRVLQNIVTESADFQVQAKRWNVPVGRPEIQKFAGALLG